MKSFDQSVTPRQDPDNFDVGGSVRSIGEAVRIHKRLVLLTCLGTLVLVSIYAFLWPPIYTAKATVMVERDVDPVRDSFYVSWNIFRKDDARTEIELMTAGPILKEVVQREKLTYADVYHPFTSHLAYLWTSSPPGRLYRWIKYKILPRDPNGPTPEQLEIARIVSDMKAGIEIVPVAESNVGRLTVDGPSPRVANIANTLLEVYLSARDDRHFGEARTASELLSEQAAIAEKALHEIEAQRLAFSNEHALIADFQKETLEIQKLVDLEGIIITKKARFGELEANRVELERQIETEPATKSIQTMYELNTIRETMKHKRLELETFLLQTRNHYREDSPEVQEIVKDIAQIDQQIEGASEKVERQSTLALNALREDLIARHSSVLTEIKATQAALKVLDDSTAKLRTRLAQMPGLRTQLLSLDRTYALAQEKYRVLQQKQVLSSVTEATSRAAVKSMRIVDLASPPDEARWPKLKYLYPGSLLVGLILGMAAAVVKTNVSTRVSRTLIEPGRGSLPLYGTIGVPTRPALLNVRDARRGPSDAA